MIINPMWFYWASACEGLKCMALIAGAVVMFVDIIVMTVRLIDEGEHPNRWMIVAFIASIVTIVIGVLIPSKNTMIEMMAASLATPENVNSVIDGLNGFVDYVVEVLG